MPQQCRLLLDNYTGHYFPGSTIQGRVLVDLDSETSMRGVKISLTCQERTEWTGTESNSNRSGTTQFTGERDVFEIKQWLYGDQNENTSLNAGQYIYPFQIVLQQNIPGTYQCEKGSVSYNLKACVDRKMAFDYVDKLLIVVNSPVDLNFIARPEDLQPSSYSDEKTVCCLCCAQGPITMDVELPRRTLIPGEQVDVKVHLNNLSSTNVENVSLELVQNFTYKATEPSKEEKEDRVTFVTLRDVGLGAHGENTYIFKVMLPPNVNLPNFTQCNLFSVDYVYKIVAHLPSVHHNLEVRIQPHLGHIPLAASSQSPPPPKGEGGMYPTLGWAGGPGAPPATAPPLNSEEQPLTGTQGWYNNQGGYEPPPPAYDSLKWSS